MTMRMIIKQIVNSRVGSIMKRVAISCIIVDCIVRKKCRAVGDHRRCHGVIGRRGHDRI